MDFKVNLKHTPQHTKRGHNQRTTLNPFKRLVNFCACLIMSTDKPCAHLLLRTYTRIYAVFTSSNNQLCKKCVMMACLCVTSSCTTSRQNNINVKMCANKKSLRTKMS